MDEKLLITFEPLIKKITTKFYGASYEDLMQVGRIGLINAYKHYDRSKNTKFSTFAYSYIFGEMYNYVVTNRTIKQNRDTLKILKLYEQTKFLLTQKLGKEPSVADVAIYLEMDEDILNNALIGASSILSLDKEEEEDTNLYNKISEDVDNDLVIDINDSINELDGNELEIIKCRYFDDLTQSETAKKLGMSQVSVSRYEKRSLLKMQKYLTYE